MRARLATALLAVCLGASACSSEAGGDDATPTLPPVTEAPSPTPEAVPSEATEATPEGAAEFVRFWFEQLNKAAVTGDTTALRRISDPACEACNRFVESIDSLYAPGGRIEGGMFTVTAVEAQAVAPEVQEARALVVYDVTPTRQVGPQGETLREVEAISNKAGDLVLTRSGGEWLMRDFA